MPSELENDANERALLFMGLSSYAAYQALGIDPDDYASLRHQRVARLLEAAFEEYGQAAGPNEQLNRVLALGGSKGIFEERDRLELWGELSDAPIGTMPDAEKLKSQRNTRDLLVALKRAQVAVLDGNPQGARSIVREAQDAALRRLDGASGILDARQMVALWQKTVADRANNQGISPGFAKLKEAIGYLHPGSVLVLGGNTGVGKSSYCIEMMLRASAQNTPMGLISMEDPAFVTINRWLATFSGISAKRLEFGLDYDRGMKGALELLEYEGRMWLAECIGGNEQHVCSRMSVMAQRGAKIVIIDYIGEVQASLSQQDRRNEVRWVMSRLKAHAVRLGIALVVVSQLSRPKDKDPGHEPSKHDLKEAGDLENSAEFIVLLWRKEEHDFAPITVKLEKSKIGGTGARWEMQREIYREENGQRVPGSARLREVVRERARPEDYDVPLLHEDYKALLATLRR